MSEQHKQSVQARVEVVGVRLASAHPVANPPCLLPPSVCHKSHRLHRDTILGVENGNQIAMQPAELPRVLAPRPELLFQLLGAQAATAGVQRHPPFPGGGARSSGLESICAG